MLLGHSMQPISKVTLSGGGVTLPLTKIVEIIVIRNNTIMFYTGDPRMLRVEFSPAVPTHPPTWKEARRWAGMHAQEDPGSQSWTGPSWPGTNISSAVL